VVNIKRLKRSDRVAYIDLVEVVQGEIEEKQWSRDFIGPVDPPVDIRI
jgi:hypothetical protein